MKLNLEFDESKRSVYDFWCRFKEKWIDAKKIAVPLKWSFSTKANSWPSEKLKDAVVILIGTFLNGGHLIGGSYYGGDYYEPWSIIVPFQKKKTYFPIPAYGETEIYALVLTKEESEKFNLAEEIRKPKGLDTNANPITIRPFPISIAKKEEGIEKEERDSIYFRRLEYSSEFYENLRPVWE